MISTDIVAGREYLHADGSRTLVVSVNADTVACVQASPPVRGCLDEGHRFAETPDNFRRTHVHALGPAESPILAMVPAAARGSVVRVDWMDEHGNLCRVECTGSAGAAPASPQDLPGGLTADQVHEIARRTRESMTVGTGLRGRKDTWDTGYDVGAEFVLGLLSEHVGEDL